MNKKMRIVTLVLGFVLVFLVGVDLGSQYAKKREVPAPAGFVGAVQVLLDNGNDRIETSATVPAKGTLLDALLATKLAVVSKDYGDMGVLVQKIGGLPKSGDTRYWQYWVNGVYGTVSASKQPVHAGDTILWKLAKDAN